MSSRTQGKEYSNDDFFNGQNGGVDVKLKQMDFNDPGLDPEALSRAVLDRGDLGRRIEAMAAVDKATYMRFFYEPILAAAAMNLALPASREHHSEPGGALRLAVESGWASMRLAEQSAFAATEPAERRRKLEPQYRIAAFIAGLCSRLALPSLALEVSAAGARWFCAMGPLLGWMEAVRASQYEITWRPAPIPHERALSGFCAAFVLPKPLDLDQRVSIDLFAAIDPAPGQDGALARVVRDAVARVEEADKRRLAMQYRVPEKAPEESFVDAFEHGFQQPAPRTEVTAAGSATSDPPAQKAHTVTAAADEVRREDPACADLLRTLAKQAERQEVRNKLSWERDGLSIPLSILGDLGLSSEGALLLLRRAGILVKKDGRRFVISEKAGARILPQARGNV